MFRVIFQLLVELFHGIQQSLQLLEVVIVRYASPHMLPDIFLWVEFRRIGWQPFNLNLMSMRFQQLTDDLGAMGFIIINKQNHLAPRVSRQLIGPGDGGQQSPKADIVAPTVNHVDCPASDGINGTPVPALRRAHPGRQNHTLLANTAPATRDGRKQAHFGRISEQENEFWSGLRFQFTDSFFSQLPVQDPVYA